MEKLYETERLVVRKWEEKDFLDLYEYCSDSDVTKYLIFPTYTSIDDAKERLAFIIDAYEKGEICVDYGIELKGTNKIIGSIGVVEFCSKNEGQIELGYILNPKYQGKGFMTEALKGMFGYIKKNNIAKRIMLKHDVENFKSGNVMKRAGMTFEGVARAFGSNNLHTRCDTAIYSILYEEI